MKKKIFLLCLIISAVGYLETDAQVNLQTGAAEYSIPLYSYSDPNNRIGTGVSLVYTAGNGLKVNEIASNTGSGWSLNTGGYIQRIQNGAPDDQKNYDNYTYPLLPDSDPQSAFWVWARNYYPNGYLHSEFLSSDQITNRGAYTPMYPSPYYYFKPPQTFSADREQDIFKFSFNGREGFFMISRPNGSGVSEIRTLYDSKLKIEKVEGDLNNTQNIRTTISKFTITDESGIKYFFEDADIDQICDFDQGSEYSAANGSFQTNINYVNSSIIDARVRVIKGTPRNSYAKSKWNLTRITNPLTGVSIQFQYETYNIDMNTQKIVQRSVSGISDRISITQERSISQLKRLKKIVLNINESVEFEYPNSGRVDVPTDKSLSRISIKYGTETKLNWDFSYGYFVKTNIRAPDYNFTTEDIVWARLCLLSLKKSGPGGLNEPSFVFDYYRGNEDNLNSAIPPMFSCQQNLGGYYSTSTFGFYNPSTTTTSTTNPPYEPYGNALLPKSVYQSILSGLDYNPSLGYGTGSSNVRPTLEARNGVIKSIKNQLGGEMKFEFEVNTVGAPPYKAFYGVRVNKTTEYDGINHSNDKVTEYKYVNLDNSSSAWGYENFQNKEVTTVRTRQDCSAGSRPLLNMYSIAKPIGNFILGQLGIVPVSSTLTSIAGTQVPVFAVAYFGYLLYAILDGFFGNSQPVYNTYTMDVYTNQLVNNNVLPFQYSRVEVVNKLGGDNIGKTVHEFTSPASSSSYQIDFSTISKPHSSKQRFAYWIYGLPENITVFDKNSKPIKKINNVYNPIKYFLNTISYLSQKWMPLQYEYSCGFVPPAEDLNTYNKISNELYSPICGRIELTTTKEYTYNDINEYTLSETFYEYSPNNYLPNKVKTNNSKGELVEKNTYYPQDYTLSGALQTMISNNIINTPVSSQTLITKSGSQKYLLSGGVSEFSIAGNGDIKVAKTHSFRNDNPVISTSVPFSGAQLIPNTTYYKETGSVVYNSTGNAVQANADNGKVSTVYDYDSKIPIATVVNASVNEVAYSSFEADGSGGWEIVAGSTILSSGGVTGKKSFSGTIRKTALPAGNYTVTVWSISNAAVTVNGVVGTPLITIGNWKLYEWKLINVTSAEIIASNIDEVRLYPSKARMSTVTYEPLIGKIAECDASNRIIYYEYDDLGRLRFIRDENRNIIKMYEYNYKR